MNFVQVGIYFLNLDAISSVNSSSDGVYTVYFTNGKYQHFPGEEMENFLMILEGLILPESGKAMASNGNE